ncbi:MAG: hypothetical protein HY763_04220 [Planctomycetes bacterium]|nr:hypothetical protein [Planctomycetota bacterium]
MSHYRFALPVAVLGMLLVSGTSASLASPTYSLWVTEVNGSPCPSCPTQDLLAGEVQPGDIIRVDAFLEHWDDQPGRGLCSDTRDTACTLGQPDSCTGSGCRFFLDRPCLLDSDCPAGSACVPRTCEPYPLAAAFQWSVEPGSLQSGLSGSLDLARVPCDPDDCEAPGDVDCPCGLHYPSADQCTCVAADSCAADGHCLSTSSVFIEAARPDFLLFAEQFLLGIAIPPRSVAIQLAGADFEGGVRDAGVKRYVGTLLLTPSGDASGDFTVRIDPDEDYTIMLDQYGLNSHNLILVPATIRLPPICPGVPPPDADLLQRRQSMHARLLPPRRDVLAHRDRGLL